jgi:hypothetical protein
MSGKRNPAKLKQRKRQLCAKRQRQRNKCTTSLPEGLVTYDGELSVSKRNLEKAGLVASMQKDPGATPIGKHPSHVTRFTFDASTYDEICVNCGATDVVPGGWGRLADPCDNPVGKGGINIEEYYAR